MVSLASTLFLLGVRISNGNALRGPRRLQENPTASPTFLTSTAGFDLSGTTAVPEGESLVDSLAENGASTPPTIEAKESINPEEGGQGDVSWFGEEGIAATTSPAVSGTDAALAVVQSGSTDSLLDEASEGGLGEISTIPSGVAPTTSPSGVTAVSITMSSDAANGATNSEVEGEDTPLIVTDPTEPVEGSDLDSGSNATDAPKDEIAIGTEVPNDLSSTTSATQKNETTESTQTTEAGLNAGDLTQSTETTSTTSGSTTPYDDEWLASNETNSTTDEENYTGMNDEKGDDSVGEESYWEGDDEAPADDETNSFYEDDDLGEGGEWSPWDEQNDDPTFRPTPRPTHHAYESPTDDVLEYSSTSAAEFDDDMKNVQATIENAEEKVKAYLDGVESPEEMEQDKNVQVVAGVLTTIFLVLWLITAHQTMENPDGLCASFCRLTLKFICCLTRVLFLPCRYLCCKDSQQNMGRRSHAPMRAPFPSDLELS